MAKIIASVFLLWVLWPAGFAAGAGAKDQDARFVGSETCKGCHDTQYASFISNSKKARSFANISKMKKKLTEAEFKECLRCHTTGYGQPGGFRSEEETPDLKNPGCEVCHGPGSVHAESGDPADLKVKVSLRVCALCHNSERVAAFGFKPVLYSGGH